MLCGGLLYYTIMNLIKDFPRNFCDSNSVFLILPSKYLSNVSHTDRDWSQIRLCFQCCCGFKIFLPQSNWMLSRVNVLQSNKYFASVQKGVASIWAVQNSRCWNFVHSYLVICCHFCSFYKETRLLHNYPASLVIWLSISSNTWTCQRKSAA